MAALALIEVSHYGEGFDEPRVLLPKTLGLLYSFLGLFVLFFKVSLPVGIHHSYHLLLPLPLVGMSSSRPER